MTIVELNLEKNVWFEMYFGISVFVAVAHEASNLKSLNQEISYKKKNEPTKYSPVFLNAVLRKKYLLEY